MNPSLTSLPPMGGFGPDQGLSGLEGGQCEECSVFRRHRLLWFSILLSLVVHVFGGWLADMRPVRHLMTDRLVILDIAASRAEPAPLPAPETHAQAAVPPSDAQMPRPAPPPQVGRTQPARTAKQAKSRPAPMGPQKAEATQSPGPKPKAPAPVATSPGLARNASIGQIVPRSGVTVLANESGQDALKHGAEARFMHGVATEEFVEDNYVGEYAMGKLGRVWIEDDRARSGHLILHAEHMGFRRPLFRFNRFIYVYGENPDSPEPILGSVTFFSDGYHIHQFLWQHNATYAYYPRRD